MLQQVHNAGSIHAVNYLALLPPVLMALFGCATLLIDVLPARHRPGGATLASGSTWRGHCWWALRSGVNGRLLSTSGEAVLALQGAISIDGLALFANALVWLSVVMLLLISYRYLDVVRENPASTTRLLYSRSAACTSWLGRVDLIALFTGLELTSISFYILVGFTRADRRSNEAALKYLLLGALSSGLCVVRIFAAVRLQRIDWLSRHCTCSLTRRDAFAAVATVTVVIGTLLKVSAAPFHFWAPDAYEGAPTPITGYLSVASKIAAFAVMIRLLTGPLASASNVWQPLLAFASVASLTIGSIAALTQDRVKRLFAYSGIAHAGYVLLGFIARPPLGIQGIYVYLLVYAVMNGGAFAVLTSLRNHGVAGDHITDLRGLSREPSRPCGAVCCAASFLGRHPAHRGIHRQVLHFGSADSERTRDSGGAGGFIRRCHALLLLPPDS